MGYFIFQFNIEIIVLADTPYVEQFRIRRTRTNGYPLVEVAWLEDKIYVVHSNMKRVRVFSDRAPFIELPEGIEIKGLGEPTDLVASSVYRSIFISDNKNLCIWKIQMPNKVVTRWEVYRGCPWSLSITPDVELLAFIKLRPSIFYKDDDEETEEERNNEDNGAEIDDDDNDDSDSDEGYYDDYLTLQVFRLTDGTRTRSMRLPQEIIYVSSAVELPNKSFVVSYSKKFSDNDLISVLSMDGENLIITRTLDLVSFESIQEKQWHPNYVAATKDGEMFVMDYKNGRVIWFNSKFTDYRIISSNDHQLGDMTCFVYIEEKQQLMVCGDQAGASTPVPLVTVFHLSPCNLAKERSKAVPDKSIFKLVKKHRTYDFTSKYKTLLTMKRNVSGV